MWTLLCWFPLILCTLDIGHSKINCHYFFKYGLSSHMIFLINNILYLCYASMNVCVFLPCRLKDVGKWLASYVYSRNKWQKLVCHPQQELLEAMILIWTTWRLLYIVILIFFFSNVLKTSDVLYWNKSSCVCVFVCGC